jgi:hypothetical protein
MNCKDDKPVIELSLMVIAVSSVLYWRRTPECRQTVRATPVSPKKGRKGETRRGSGWTGGPARPCSALLTQMRGKWGGFRSANFLLHVRYCPSRTGPLFIFSGTIVFTDCATRSEEKGAKG